MFDTLQVPLTTSIDPFVEEKKGDTTHNGHVSLSILSTTSRIQALGSKEPSQMKVKPVNGSFNSENGNPI